ncbi:Response regulator receiver domain-containing protein [Filimonas lacunae]|uniref:Response regulator receiver domain-containing protein n=1 Tax=Filimonas lacunae TaxID=477680 RepID=A0A173MPF8_9BACT|nr:response regulator [Filimonas lacunae]BAV09366.1 alkaline phosphatase synthesis transcriptional regulatory protein [Filimonas lacunae]SIS71836.1 Response regulator receiver domain-containing protein [Filimonas lacunae]
MKILIVEDEPFILQTLEECLKSGGYEVITARDGRDALISLQKSPPDLILTDIMMPYTSGLELIGITRSSGRMEIPIIVLSGIDEEATVMEAFRLGADDFISKPFNAPELLLRVKRLLLISPRKNNKTAS